MTCKCLNTERWVPNDGNLLDETAKGHSLLIKHPSGNIAYLDLCKECGATFAPGSLKDKRRRTAATLRELEKLA